MWSFITSLQCLKVEICNSGTAQLHPTHKCKSVVGLQKTFHFHPSPRFICLCMLSKKHFRKMLNEVPEIATTASDPRGHLPSLVGNWSVSDTFRAWLQVTLLGLFISSSMVPINGSSCISADPTPVVCEPSKHSLVLVNQAENPLHNY